MRLRMEHAMQNDAIRRRSNGTIDIDSYRRDALMLREQTRTEFFRSIGRAVRPLTDPFRVRAAPSLRAEGGPDPGSG